jgi:Glycosyl transferase family 2
MATRPRLSVVIPTQGRDTLRRALVSIRDETQPADTEIIIVADTYEPLLDDVAWIARAFGAVYLEHDAGHHGYGHPQLALGYRAASCAYIAALGDDDEYLPGALGVVTEIMDALPEPGPVLFRLTMYPSRSRRIFVPETIWRDPVLYCGNVSSQSLVVPNDPDKLGEYPSHSTGDYDFIRQTVDMWGGAERLTWRPEVICCLR